MYKEYIHKQNSGLHTYTIYMLYSTCQYKMEKKKKQSYYIIFNFTQLLHSPLKPSHNIKL